MPLTVNQTPVSLVGRQLFFCSETHPLEQADDTLRKLLDDHRGASKASVSIHRDQYQKDLLRTKQLVDQKPHDNISPRTGWYRVIGEPNHLQGAVFVNLEDIRPQGGQSATLLHLYKANDHRLVWGRGIALLHLDQSGTSWNPSLTSLALFYTKVEFFSSTLASEAFFSRRAISSPTMDEKEFDRVCRLLETCYSPETLGHEMGRIDSRDSKFNSQSIAYRPDNFRRQKNAITDSQRFTLNSESLVSGTRNCDEGSSFSPEAVPVPTAQIHFQDSVTVISFYNLSLAAGLKALAI